jgi:hypothetical protein
MSSDEVIKFFRELGFPAAVAAFVLWRIEARLRELSERLALVNLALAALVRIGDETNRTLEKVPLALRSSPPGRSDRGE